VADELPRAIAWHSLDRLYLRYLDPSKNDVRGSARWELREVRVTAMDSTEIAAGTGYGVRVLNAMRDRLDEVVTALRLPAAIQQCQSGVPVSFGHLSVSQEGIAWKDGAKKVAWENIRRFEVWPYQLAVVTGAVGGPRIMQAGVPDWCVAVGLIRNVAARRGIPEKGHAQP
jgi:hypothetical protein